MSEYPKVKQEITNPVNENIQALAQLFPAVVKDGAVDFEALKEELGNFPEVGKEKYELNWAGKQNAKKIVQEDVVGKTLKFIPDDSKNVDTTQNLYIEGDNLEVLKLLRQNYYKSIKMIYIDPPYNTGSDFVYKDNFDISQEESDLAEGHVDADGNRLVANPKSGNRYHANWLNMIYPRLKIAKDLLTEDGVIFISIGETELDNLKEISKEIFGEVNFISMVSRIAKKGSSMGNFFSPSLDYLIVCAKNKESCKTFSEPLSEDYISKYKMKDELGPFVIKGLYQSSLDPLRGCSNQRYFIECPDGSFAIPPGNSFPEIISDGAKINPKSRNDKVWRWSQESYLSQKHRLSFNKSKNSPLLDENGNSSNWNVYTKQYLHEIQEKGYVPSNLIDENTNSIGSKELKELGVDFDFPKPSTLIGYLARIIDFNSSDILLDFFSGSATTAHAVMQLNAEDGGNRKYICVQLPEPCDENSEAYKAGYKNICEIGKERIRRAGEKIVAQLKEKQNGQQQLLESEGAIVNPDTLDIGFKVFRVAYSNIRWTHDAINNTGLTPIEEIQFSQKDLLDFMIHFTDIDVVYEILLRQRDIPLSSKVEQISKIGNRTYMFADSYVVCLEEQITKELIEALAAIEPLPIKYVFRDSAFEDDISLKDETFRRLQALISRNTGESKKTYTVEFI